MATKKQLAALARGRAIRQQKLRNRKTSKKTKAIYKNKKHTKNEFVNNLWDGIKNTSKKFKAVSEVAGDILAPFNFVLNGLETIKRTKDAVGTLFEDEKKLDSTKMKIVVGNMKKKLLNRDPDFRNTPLYEKLDEIYKNLLYIEMLKNNGDESEATKEIRHTLYLFSRAIEEYNRKVGR